MLVVLDDHDAVHRDQLEADMWRAITYHRVTCDYPVALIEDLVKVAVSWLTADGPEQQARDQAMGTSGDRAIGNIGWLYAHDAAEV